MAEVSHVTCSDLLCRVAQGERAAFRMLYDQSAPRLSAICLRMMTSRAEAEEVLQDVFVKIWERSWQFDPAKGDGLGWMAIVARHTALDRLRARKGGHVSIDDDVSAEIDLAMSVQAVDTSDQGDLARCLGGLRDDYRNAVVMAYVRGMTHEELAVAMNKPLGTIKSWITRGLAQLKDCMSP